MANSVFDTPNALEATDNCFNLTVHESWGEEEAGLIFRAFKKVEDGYRK